MHSRINYIFCIILLTAPDGYRDNTDLGFDACAEEVQYSLQLFL
jgi:hypothetical protein